MIKRLVKVGISMGVRCWDLLRSPLNRCLGRSPLPGHAVVLYYHAIRAEHRARFASQLDDLVRLAEPVRAESLVSIGPAQHQAAITFDDGYVSVLENAVPEMKKRNIPFTLFVPTGCLGKRPSWVQNPNHAFWEERVMSEDELRAIAPEPLATVGSHSVTHPAFHKLTRSQAEFEFIQSKTDLEAILGREVSLFSFPHGSHNAALDQQARQSGYRRVFTAEAGNIPCTDGFIMGRVPVEPDDWRLEFRLKVKGAYRWQYHVQAVRKKLFRWRNN